MKNQKKIKIAKEVATQILSLLRKKGAMDMLPVIIAELNRHAMKARIKVVSAKGLDNNQKRKVKVLVSKLTGDTAEDIDFIEDKNLIDGIKIMYKDKIWDFSLKTKIRNLA